MEGSTLTELNHSDSHPLNFKTNKGDNHAEAKDNQVQLSSPYMRGNFHVDEDCLLTTKKIDILISDLTLEEGNSPVKFTVDVNELDRQKYIKAYIDKLKTQYVLIQEQKSSSDNPLNNKSIVIRSPLSINNTLKIPIEIKLNSKHNE